MTSDGLCLGWPLIAFDCPLSAFDDEYEVCALLRAVMVTLYFAP